MSVDYSKLAEPHDLEHFVVLLGQQLVFSLQFPDIFFHSLHLLPDLMNH